MSHRTDEQRIARERNTARFFVENPHIAWVVLLATLVWGVFGFSQMPKRKDPEFPIRIAVVVCPWPGASAEKIEQLVTKKIERKLAENSNIDHIDSTVRTNVSVTTVLLREVSDLPRELDDLKGKLDAIDDLPEHAGPIVFLKDFRDTATLMLTVASPKADAMELAVRALSVRRAIEQTRAGEAGRTSLVIAFPPGARTAALPDTVGAMAGWLTERGLVSEVRRLERPGFVGLDMKVAVDDAALLAAVTELQEKRLRQSDLNPDVWAPVLVHAPEETEARLASVAGPRYSYRELDDFTETIQRALQSSPLVSRVSRLGLLPEVVNLTYSQQRLAASGLAPTAIRDALAARNIDLAGGIFESAGRNLPLVPTGELSSEKELGDVMVGGSIRGSPAYLRDLFEISRDYQSPARYLNTLTRRGADGRLERSRAVTLAVLMRSGGQVAAFGDEVDALLARTRAVLPGDLLITKTSDQPLQVEEIFSLFMRSLLEAVALVVLVAFIGFWEWRSALLIALSIPLTLAMTFGLMHLLHVDLQQVSIASLIIALGLLVDDPVVAGDAIKRELEAGHSRSVSAWLGPTKLANAIVFATITNIAAYLPFLSVHDYVGSFIYSLPVVLTCSLVASRVVSMTFVPLLGRLLLRPDARREPSKVGQRFADSYRRLSGWMLDHRKGVLAVAALALFAGVPLSLTLKSSFFPKDLSYLFYVDVWTPEDSTLSKTSEAAASAEEIIRRVTDAYASQHPGEGGRPRAVLRSITSFVGGGGPRFWFSVNPEQSQLNYAQLVVQLDDKHDTAPLVPILQRALSESMVGASADVRQLETGEPVGVPVSIRFAGPELSVLRDISERAKAILRETRGATRVRDDWGAETLSLPLKVEADRANLSGVTNLDVALSALAATNGAQVTTLRENDRQIPVLLRLRPADRAGLEDLGNLYVFSARDGQKVPLRQVASVGLAMQPEKIKRRNQFRTITVSAFPAEGVLASEVLAAAQPRLEALERNLPPGYRLEYGGEQESQRRGFKQVATAMVISVLLIYLVLVFEFRNAIKPFVVFAAIPFGALGALASLAVAGVPFGFMAFLGIASLIGVIVSHVVVLFDFIEVAQERGVPLREALIEAGIVRLRPVLVTVAATVLGLLPLATHGGPLWEPLCYAQFGGLSIATVVTLLLVPVIYSVFVLDLRIVRWAPESPAATGTAMAATSASEEQPS